MTEQRVYLSAILVVATCIVPAMASDAAPAPTAAQIAAALNDQESRCGKSLEIEFTYTWGGEVAPHRCRYVRTPEMIRLDEEDDNWVWTGSYDRIKHGWRLLTKHAGSFTGETGSDLSGKLLEWGFPETTHFRIGRTPLCDIIGSGKVSPTMETVDGQECWRVDIPSWGTPNPKTLAVWVDPAVGMSPRRIKLTRGEQKPVVASFKGYRSVGEGVWFPTEVLATYNVINSSEPATRANKITKVSIGRVIPSEDLAVSFPPGTAVQTPVGESTAH